MSVSIDKDSKVQTYNGPATFVVGPEKTATTFIQMLLEEHPDVNLPVGIKETFFFDRFYDNGLDWYLARFDHSDSTKRLVEVAPGYFSVEEAILRIKKDFPAAKIVFCVRDLVERTISHHQHMRRYGYTKVSLIESLNPKRLPLRASLYKKYCPLWENTFGDDNVTLLDMAILKENPALFAQQVFEAVGVPSIEVPESILNTRANEAAEPRSYAVAKLATMVSNRLKQWGLYKVLEYTRVTPLHKLVYGSKRIESGSDIDAASRNQLRELLAEDYAFLAERYNIHFNEKKTVGTDGNQSG